MTEKTSKPSKGSHKLELLRGSLGVAISLNDCRIAGAKSGTYEVVARYSVDHDDLRAAMVTDPDLYQRIRVHGYDPEYELLQECHQLLSRKATALERRQLAARISKHLGL